MRPLFQPPALRELFLGHPIAATGERIVVTMVHELHCRGLSTSVVSMCAGGAVGFALVLEVV